MGWWWPAAGLGAVSVVVHAWDLLKEVPIIFTTSTIVWPQVNNREGLQLHPTTENWIKALLIMAPPIRTRPVFLSQSLPSGSFHKPLILLPRGQTDLKPQSQKTNQSDHMDHSSVQLNETMSHRATQDGRVIVESSDKMWSTGEWNSKSLQCSFLENSMNSMKGKKI